MVMAASAGSPGRLHVVHRCAGLHPRPARAGSFAPSPPPPDAPVEAAQRRAVVQALAQALRGHYVFPEVAERAARDLDQRSPICGRCGPS